MPLLLSYQKAMIEFCGEDWILYYASKVKSVVLQLEDILVSLALRSLI